MASAVAADSDAVERTGWVYIAPGNKATKM